MQNQRPSNIVKVTGAKGGESYLILGEEKVALYDCGMAYCADKLLWNIKAILGDRAIDLIVLSHTHYDHVGALAYIRKAYPNTTVYSASHGKKVFEKEGALRLMRKLSYEALEMFEPGSKRILDYEDKDMYADIALLDGDEIDLGGGTSIVAITAPGHTKCSIAYYLPKEKVMFPSESTGVMCNYGELKPSILTSYLDAIASVEKCSKFDVKHIITSHYGYIEDKDAKKYWAWGYEGLEKGKNLIVTMHEAGHSKDEILAEYTVMFRVGIVLIEQPLEAFSINSMHFINVVLREFYNIT